MIRDVVMFVGAATLGGLYLTVLAWLLFIYASRMVSLLDAKEAFHRAEALQRALPDRGYEERFNHLSNRLCDLETQQKKGRV